MESKNTDFKNEALSSFPNSLTTYYELTRKEIEERFPGADLSSLGLSLNRYQKEANKTKAYKEKYAIVYPALGLAEEAGEVAGKIKKWLRGDVENLNIEAVKKELGDVLWYIASLSTDLGITLEDVALTNIEKLSARAKTGTLKGDGDDREKTVSFKREPFDLGEKQPFIGDILDSKKDENDKLKADYINSFPTCKG